MEDEEAPRDVQNTETPDPEGLKELTDLMMIELSRRISSEDDIRRLSVNGLGVQAHIVDNCIRQSQNRKYPDMSCAMYDVLKTWYKTHCSRTQAYTNLCIAVRKVHMDFLIKVLERKGHNGGYSRPEIDSDKELTDVMLLRLALRLSVKELPQMRTFVEVGLKIESHVMNRELANHGHDFNLAMFRVLIRFTNRYDDKREAYAVLAQALRKANMDPLINEILEIEEETEVVCSDEGGKELTQKMRHELSLRITSEIDIFVLGLIGMKMEISTVHSHIHNNQSDLSEAMFFLLEYYSGNFEAPSAAYTGLCTALRHKEVKLTYLIKEVLEEKETGTREGPEGNPRLNDAMINKLAECVYEEDEYRKLAKSALKMRDYEVERCIEKNKGFFNATYDILHKWRNSQPDGQVAFKNLLKVLNELDMQDLVNVLEGNETEIEKKLDQEDLDRAYEIACREGTMEVFNARMTLAGYHGAGKTSVTTRLMGERLDVEKSQSTEGIAMHKVKSKLKGGEWEKTKSSTTDLWKDFSCGVLTKTRKRRNEEILQIPGANENSAPQKKISKKDSYLIATTRSTQIDESCTPSIPNECPSKTQPTKVELDSKETNKIPPMEAKTRRMLTKHGLAMQNKESGADLPYTLTLWDLGGQNEFMAMHHIFLNVESTTLIVMDITKKLKQRIGIPTKLDYLNTTEEVLHYWLNSIHIEAESKKLKPNIALILTHKNMIKGDKEKWTTEYINTILKSVQGREYADYVTDKNIFAVDNRVEDDSDFVRLRAQLLEHFKQQKSWGMEIPIRWLKLKVDCLEKAKAKDMKHLNLFEVKELAQKCGMGNRDVLSFLQRQNTLGDFIYYSDAELSHIVITDPQWLVDACTDLITNELFLNRKNIPYETFRNLTYGEVTEEDLKNLWKEDEIEFLKNLMKKFDLLIDISEGEESRYIIPCMLPEPENDDEIDEAFLDMERVYDARYKQVTGHRFVIGTFHRLLSRCSKEEDWKLCTDAVSMENHLSYTAATFDIREGMKMALTLSSAREIRVRIWCPKDVLDQGIATIYEEIVLDRKMKKLNVMTKEITKRSSGQELSDQKLLSLSEEITDSGQLRCLAIHGLQVKPKTVESCLTNAKKISEAAYQVIRGWINNEPDRKVAYDKMCRALAHDEVKLRLLIHEVLNKRE